MTAMTPIHDHRPFLFVPAGAADGDLPTALARDAHRAARVPAPAGHGAEPHVRLPVLGRRHMQGHHVPVHEARAVNLAARQPQDALPGAAGTGEPRALNRAWEGVRRVAAQAVQRRMRTEMADLAGRIRKLHDIEPR